MTCVKLIHKVTYMTKTQVYLPEQELAQLQHLAKRIGRSMADLIREAIRETWLRTTNEGPVALWKGPTQRTSIEHDTIYDEV